MTPTLMKQAEFLKLMEAVTVDIPHGETDDENFDDDETEIVDGGEAEIERAAQDLVVDASSPDGIQEVAESTSPAKIKTNLDGAEVKNKKARRRHWGTQLDSGFEDEEEGSGHRAAEALGEALTGPDGTAAKKQRKRGRRKGKNERRIERDKARHQGGEPG